MYKKSNNCGFNHSLKTGVKHAPVYRSIEAMPIKNCIST